MVAIGSGTTAAVLLALLAVLPVRSAAAGGAGERLYLDGMLPSGQPLEATVLGDVPLRGEKAACVNCHRRSGLGSSEGGKLALPVAADFLFQPRQTRWRGPRQTLVHERPKRPAYDATSLLRVLRAGVDPSGRELDPLMPRFDIDRSSLDVLIPYLRQLAVRPDPGVTESKLHLATIVTEGVRSDRERAYLDVLETFFRDRVSHTRHEPRRAESPPWNKEWEYAAYRDWVLHVWRLHGRPSTWRRQLEVYYQAQPVFAAVSGLGSGTWEPVHRFCEDNGIPCLLPNTPRPVVSTDTHFSLYFSKGLQLEGAALARHLTESRGPLLQIYRPGSAGGAAAAAFRAAIGRSARVIDFPLAGEWQPSRWRTLLKHYQPSRLVVWLKGDEIADLEAAAELMPTGPCRIFLSSAQVRPASVAEPAEKNVCFTHRRSLPEESQTRQRRVAAWLRARGLEPAPGTIQANTFFAVTLVGHALTHLRSLYSREYLLETIEHTIDSAIPTHGYPRLPLGSGQRYASKGCWVARPEGDPPRLRAVSEWIVPDLDPRQPATNTSQRLPSAH